MRELTAKEAQHLEEIIETELDAFQFLTKNYKLQLLSELTEAVIFYIENEL